MTRAEIIVNNAKGRLINLMAELVTSICKKDEREEIRVDLDDFKEQPFVEVEVYEPYTGEYYNEKRKVKAVYAEGHEWYADIVDGDGDIETMESEELTMDDIVRICNQLQRTLESLA